MHPETEVDLMSPFWVIAVIIVIGWILFRGFRTKPLLTVEIKIHPSGRYEVDVLTDQTSQELLPQLTLCYLAKIRWLLLSEPEGVTAGTRTLVGEAVEYWPKAPGAIIPDLPIAGQMIKAYGPGEWTVKDTERFVVSLFPQREGGHYITNTLPVPVKKSNYPWNFMVLLDFLSEVLTGLQRDRFHAALQRLYPLLFGGEVGGGLEDLKVLMSYANAAWDETEPVQNGNGEVEASGAQVDDSEDWEPEGIDLGKFFYLLKYRDHYSELLDGIPHQDRAIAELFLFRAWTTQAGFRLFSSDPQWSEEIVGEVINLGRTLGQGILKLQKVDVEATLGGDFMELLDDRWQRYDRIVIAQRDEDSGIPTSALCAEALGLCKIPGLGFLEKLPWLAIDFSLQLRKIREEAVRVGQLEI